MAQLLCRRDCISRERLLCASRNRDSGFSRVRLLCASRNRDCTKGFTLTEIAIVLMIIGVILGAIWIAAAMLMNVSRATQTVQDISTIAANVRSSFMAVNSFSSGQNSNQTSAMITAGIIPSDLIAPSGAAAPAMDAWNQQVIIWTNVNPTNPSYASNRVFRVSFYGTPPDACLRIASQLASLGTSDAPIALITNGASSFTSIPNSGGVVGLTTTQITTACNKNPAGGSGASTEFDYTIH